MRRFRFSLRTLVILVAVVCCALASWHWTKTRGVKAIRQIEENEPTKAVAPFLLACYADEIHGGVITTMVTKRRYYIWFFGFVKELGFMASESSQPMTLEQFEVHLKRRKR
jgi:hypothetical protein